MGDPADRPRVLIEEFIPAQELGIESKRERSASSALPPLYFLHVWWARRPLTASRAAVLASMLPADTDRDWFLKTLGIMGDPVAAQADIQRSKRTGEQVDGYGYPRAFQYTPPEDVVREVRQRIASLWGHDDLVVLDPMAGGGSIPFEAMRYGFDTYANELNPVAAVILEATLRYPAQFGPGLAKDIRRWAEELHRRVRPQLGRFYPKQPGEEIFAYVWARTVTCPNCGLIVPLSPNWWLTKTGDNDGTAVRLLPPERGQGDTCAFEIVEIRGRQPFDPNDTGTVSRGTGRCPRCRFALEGDYIKAEAQAGRMAEQMYAIVSKTTIGKGFRTATPDDVEADAAARDTLGSRLQEWEAAGVLPSEDVPRGNKTSEPLRYGMPHWSEMFTPRQLLSHVTHVEALNRLKPEILAAEGEERARAIITYIAIIFDKCIDRNSRYSTWIPQRAVIGHTFDRHDFSFKWAPAEFDHSDMLWPWAAAQVLDAYEGLAELAAPTQNLFDEAVAARIHVTQGDAAAYRDREPESVDVICVDPPYYDNVMYAECSDFFYVWQKRTLGDIYPEWFGTELTDKEREAVANVARFAGMKGSKKQLAEQDYEAKMRAVFARCHTVLRPAGVMTIMFTHKRVEAWDTLAAALISAGFEITAAWPIHTEFEHSLHQAKKNACSSTILLVCRKRPEGKNGTGYWWDDVEAQVRDQVRAKVEEFEALGMSGVDLMVSTFGPALQVISEHWPVRDRTGKEIRPDVALDEARRVVTGYRVRTLLSRAHGEVPFDPPTRWTILAWDLYQAARFPYDEGRKLALAVGVDLDATIKGHDLAYKESQDIVLREPGRRVKRGTLDPQADEFTSIIDAVHAALYIYDEDGVSACRRFLEDRQLARREEFVAAVEALLKAMPQARREWGTLREMALAFLSGRIEIPEPEQYELGLDDGDDEDDEADEDDEQ